MEDKTLISLTGRFTAIETYLLTVTALTLTTEQIEELLEAIKMAQITPAEEISAQRFSRMNSRALGPVIRSSKKAWVADFGFR